MDHCKCISASICAQKSAYTFGILDRVIMYLFYSIVKDSSADLGVNYKIAQIRPTVKAVSTKISKKKIHTCQYFDEDC